MTIIVTMAGIGSGPAIDHAIGCNVYVDGVLRAHLGGVGVGPAAAGVNAVTNVPIGAITYCVVWNGAERC